MSLTANELRTIEASLVTLVGELDDEPTLNVLRSNAQQLRLAVSNLARTRSSGCPGAALADSLERTPTAQAAFEKVVGA